MWTFFKSIALGAILTFVVCLFTGSGGSSGGMLNIRHFRIEGFGFYWSWMLFVAGSALSAGVLSLMA